ncbi:hypothetical protein B9G55_11475 [Saccharibacillus sp. O16]|nr:hypothetical protein B9G55_11475 [Saccharibacillus sp. O16]
MMPTVLALTLGAAILAGAAIALLAVRSKRRRLVRSNLVDLASVRRRKLKEAANRPMVEQSVKIKRPLSSPGNAEIRRFIPKTGEGRLQSCSRCHKKRDSVGFFVDEYGHLVGVCKECRKSAKNRDLMPL